MILLPSDRMAHSKEHIGAATLEQYSLQVSLLEAREAVECHLQICPACRDRLEGIELFNMTHYTPDGLFCSRVTQLQDGSFWAHHWGCQVDVWGRFRDHSDAVSYLLDSFIQMFPKHECSKRCTGARVRSSHHAGW
jgi:hypothetical protein